MFYRALLLVSILLIAALALGCGSSSTDPVAPVNVPDRITDYLPENYCGVAGSVELIAGQNTDVGEVIVTNDNEYLYVEFVVNAPWYLVETHVAVSDTLGGIPQTKSGNPQIGKYAYNIDSFIDLGDWCDGTELFISAHAVVEKVVEGEVVDEQTAWGEGDDFDGNSWAMYFRYTVQSCCSFDLSLPADPVQAQLYHWGTNAYWDTNLIGVPAGFSVSDGIVYNGWCVDLQHYLSSGTLYTVQLYSSYDPNMPAYAMDDDWDLVNYLLNHKAPGASLQDIQDAVWYFIDGTVPNGPPLSNDPHLLEMIADTEANGEGFIPSVCDGEVIAVILDPLYPNTSGGKSQITIIEVGCE